MDISIIIVSYNTKNLLHNCLESIYKTNSKISFEIIVIDNNSHDLSPEMVRTNFPQVILHENQNNLGFSTANNQGIKLSSGRYILLLNSDTEILNNCLDHLVQFADQHLEAGVIGCTHLDANKKPTTSFAYGFLAPRPVKSKKVLSLKKGWLSGACILIRRSAGEQVHWLDEDFFFGSEDLDLCWKMLKTGWKVYFTPKAQIIHYGAQSSGKNFNPRIYYESKRGSGLLIHKHGNSFQKIIWSFLMLLQVLPDFTNAFLNNKKQEIYIYKKIIKMCFSHDFSIKYQQGDF